MIRLQTFVLTLIFSKELIIIDMGRGSVGEGGGLSGVLNCTQGVKDWGQLNFDFFNMITFLPVIAPTCLRQTFSSLTSLF